MVSLNVASTTTIADTTLLAVVLPRLHPLARRLRDRQCATIALPPTELAIPSPQLPQGIDFKLAHETEQSVTHKDRFIPFTRESLPLRPPTKSERASSERKTIQSLRTTHEQLRRAA